MSVAIVSGAASGLGLAFAKRLHEAGYDVVAFDTAPPAEDTKGIQSLIADVSRRTDVERVIDTAAGLGPIQIVVNNAGTWQRTPVTSDWKTALRDYDHIIDTNVRGVLMLSRAAVPHLKRAAGGHIINVSTYYVLPARSAGTNQPDTDLYNASKWALNGFTDAWAKRLAPHGVKVCGMCMGAVDTPMLRGLFPDGELPPDLARAAFQPADLAEQMMAIIESGRSGENFGAFVGESLDLPPVPPPHMRITG